MKGTKIGQYRQLCIQASELEREGELAHAAKLWRRAAEVVQDWRPHLVTYCANRAGFCDGALKRQKGAA